MEIFQQHMEKDVPSIDVSEKFNILIKGLTDKNPKERWGYEEVKKFLEAKNTSLFSFFKKIKELFFDNF